MSKQQKSPFWDGVGHTKNHGTGAMVSHVRRAHGPGHKPVMGGEMARHPGTGETVTPIRS